MTFHVFYPKTWEGGYYLDYDSEATMDEIIDSILHDPAKPKMECPAIVLNRFKTVNTQHGTTVKNRYENLLHTTGWFGLDVDECGAKTKLVKNILFEKLPEVKICWISPSKQGVKAIGFSPKLVNLTPRQFTIQYRVMTMLMRSRCGMKINFDQAMSRCHQPIFINSDKKAYVR